MVHDFNICTPQTEMRTKACSRLRELHDAGRGVQTRDSRNLIKAFLGITLL